VGKRVVNVKNLDSLFRKAAQAKQTYTDVAASVVDAGLHTSRGAIVAALRYRGQPYHVSVDGQFRPSPLDLADENIGKYQMQETADTIGIGGLFVCPIDVLLLLQDPRRVGRAHLESEAMRNVATSLKLERSVVANVYAKVVAEIDRLVKVSKETEEKKSK
jgi:hypothetical protein